MSESRSSFSASRQEYEKYLDALQANDKARRLLRRVLDALEYELGQAGLEDEVRELLGP